jgi:hypothetical protein
MFICNVFEPKLFYSGEWGLSSGDKAKNDRFMLNAAVVGGKNLYAEFLNKNYYKPLSEIFKSEDIANFFNPKIISTDWYHPGERTIHFSFSHWLLQALPECELEGGEVVEKVQAEMDRQYDIYCKEDSIATMDTKLLVDPIRDYFRKKNKKFLNVQRSGKQSEHYTELYEQWSAADSDISFDDFIEWNVEANSKIIWGFRSIPEFFEKKIDPSEFVSCFDYDGLSLCLAYSLLEASIKESMEIGGLGGSAACLDEYVELVEEKRRSNPDFNPKIVDKDENGRKVILTADDLMKEARRLFVRYPSQMVRLNYDQVDSLLATLDNIDLSTKAGSIEFKRKVGKLFEDKAISCDWEKLRSDELLSIRELLGGTATTPPLLEDEKIRRVYLAQQFLDSSPFVYRLKGLNKFAGYIAYLYPNKSVVFEKFYKDQKCTRVDSGNATYVMNLYNFIELSKLTKLEATRKLRDLGPEAGHKINHGYDMTKWEARVAKAIMGEDHTDEVVNHVEDLFEQDVLSKEEPVKLILRRNNNS